MNFVELVADIPQLAGIDLDALAWQPMGGYTNQNYRLVGQQFDYILRLPRPETNQWIDRSIESHNLGRAVVAGVAPGFHYFNHSGVMLSDTLVDAHQLTAEQLQDTARLALVIKSVKQVHQLRPGFHGQVNLAELVNRYYYLMPQQDQQDLSEAYQQAQALLVELTEKENQPLVSSHNDLVLQNLLLQEDQLWLIDWEYSSQASPYWDLATLCNEADFDEQDAREIIALYAGRDSDLQAQQLNRYRTLLRFLGDCWYRTFRQAC